MAIKIINGKLVDTSEVIKGSGTPYSSTLGGNLSIKPTPIKPNNILSGYTIGTGTVPFGTQASPVKGGAPIPKYIEGPKLVPYTAPASNPAPVVIPTVVAPAIKPTTTTLAPNDASYKYRADNGELNTNYSGYSAPRIAPIGSIASLYTDEEQSMLDSLNQQNESDAFQEIDPEAVYKKTLASYQSQIDAINNIYNDQLTQSRITNAPDYQARQDENRIQQLMGGFGSSAMGSAQTNRVTELNNQEQASAEAIINDKRQTAIASIYGLARKSSEDELTRKYQAQKEGSKAVLAEINERPERRKKALSNAVKTLIDKLGIEIDGFNDEEVAKLSKELGVTPDQFQAEWNSQASTYAAEANAADLKQRKAEADLAKTEAETSQIGKMTPYQSAQVAVDWYKAKNPNIPASDKKLNAIGGIATLFSPSETLEDGTKTNVVPGTDNIPYIDENGYATPEGWKTVQREATSDNVTKKDLLAQFGGLIPVGLETAYGLTASDIKILRGELPTTD